MRTILISKIVMFSILGIPIFLSTFNIENGQNQIFAVSQDGNITGNTENKNFVISDINGTEIFSANVEVSPWCPEGGGVEGCIEWPGLGSLLATTLDMNMTIVAPNGQEILFENIQIKCTPSEEMTEFAIQCGQI